MRSLKIIIFRDTDKPYTIIIPSYVLVTAAFLVISVFALLAFSLVGNVMLYADSIDADTQVEQTAALTEGSGIKENQEVPTEDQDLNQTSGDQNDEGITSETDQNIGINTEDRSSEEGQSETEDLNSDSENLPAFSPESFDFNTDGYTAEAALLGPVVNTANAISFRAQVRKAGNRGIQFQGRFIAALADADGNVDSTFPRSIDIEDGEVSNPDAGNSFRISYRRDYQVELRKQPGSDYKYLLLFIYDSDTNDLHWKKAIPLQ